LIIRGFDRHRGFCYSGRPGRSLRPGDLLKEFIIPLQPLGEAFHQLGIDLFLRELLVLESGEQRSSPETHRIIGKTCPISTAVVEVLRFMISRFRGRFPAPAENEQEDTEERTRHGTPLAGRRFPPTMTYSTSWCNR